MSWTVHLLFFPALLLQTVIVDYPASRQVGQSNKSSFIIILPVDSVPLENLIQILIGNASSLYIKLGITISIY